MVPLEVRSGRCNRRAGERDVRPDAADRRGGRPPRPEENAVNGLYILVGAIAFGLVIYLVAALLNPEELG